MTGSIPAPAGLLTELPTSAVLLDAARLTEKWGGRVRVHYLRYKPGTSLVAALRTDDGPAWAVCHVDPDKLHKVRVRADRHDTRMVSLGPGAAAGSIGLDRVVGKGHRRLVRLAPTVLDETGPVTTKTLRYNPSRRVVVELQAGGRPVAVGRVGRPGSPLRTDLLDDLHRAGLATPVLSADTDRGLLVLGWRPGTVRDRLTTDAEREAVAATLDRMARVSPSSSDQQLYDERWWNRSLAEAGSAIAALDPGLGVRAADVLARIDRPDFGRLRLIHGDFSADQIVWDGDEPGLIDFDRAGFGPAWLDPASLLATDCLDQGDVGPADGLPAAIRRGAAHAVVRRATEPFRRVDPGWPEAVARRLDLAAELAS